METLFPVQITEMRGNLLRRELIILNYAQQFRSGTVIVKCVLHKFSFDLLVRKNVHVKRNDQ